MSDPHAEPAASPSASQAPGERRLPHPPSDRYAVPDVVAPVKDNAASPNRGPAYAAGAAVVGAGAMTVLGGVLAVSAGLLVVAGATGWAVAACLRVGGRPQIASRRRVRLALLLAAVAVGLGQLGLWSYARFEGGVLNPVDYLSETFGALVPLQLMIAWIAAWAAAR